MLAGSLPVVGDGDAAMARGDDDTSGLALATALGDGDVNCVNGDAEGSSDASATADANGLGLVDADTAAVVLGLAAISGICNCCPAVSWSLFERLLALAISCQL